MRSPLVSIVIVNWNGRELLPACLDSLRKQTFRDFETIVVDNGSHDGSIELIRETYPWVKIVQLAENSGFASGNNAGFSVSRGSYIVTLNNDTRVDPLWLAELTAPVENDPGIGMVASRICGWDDPDQIDSLGVAICRDGMSRGNFRHQNFSALSINKIEQILIPSACAALYRRSMVDEIGFFDDDFFAYCEDTDLGLRGRLAGWSAVLARDAIVFHRYSRSGGEFSPFKLYLVERNHFWVVLKNFPLSLLLTLPFWTIVRYIVQAFLIVVGRGAGGQFRNASSGYLVKAVLRGLADMVRELPAVSRKRRFVKSISRISSDDMKRLLQRYHLTFRGLLDAG